MTRIMKRPAALLDGAPEATRLVEQDSDAERMFDEEKVFANVATFMARLALLANPAVYRIPGPTKVIQGANYTVIGIHGDPSVPPEQEPMYAFGLGPDTGEFIQIFRIDGNDATVLAWADVQEIARPVFRTPELNGVIDAPEKVSSSHKLWQPVKMQSNALCLASSASYCIRQMLQAMRSILAKLTFHQLTYITYNNY